jgi:lysophospholipase L1-like esterase
VVARWVKKPEVSGPKEHDALMAQHPEWLSSDGSHPNGLGYAAAARVFEDAYRKIAPA